MRQHREENNNSELDAGIIAGRRIIAPRLWGSSISSHIIINGFVPFFAETERMSSTVTYVRQHREENNNSELDAGIIAGRNPVTEALKADRPLNYVYLSTFPFVWS